LIGRWLRPAEGARPSPLQPRGRGPDGAGKRVVGSGEGEVKLALTVARAEVDIHALEPGGRVDLPPSVVLDCISHDIAGEVAVLKAGLGRALDASVRAAHHLGFLALIGEAVLHLERYCAADRIEPVE